MLHRMHDTPLETCSTGKLRVERWAYGRHSENGGEQLVPLEHRPGLVDGGWTPQ